MIRNLSARMLNLPPNGGVLAYATDVPVKILPEYVLTDPGPIGPFWAQDLSPDVATAAIRYNAQRREVSLRGCVLSAGVRGGKFPG